MNRLVVLLVAWWLASGPASAADPAAALMAAGRMSTATGINSAPPLDPDDFAWQAASPVTLAAYPQQAIAPGLDPAALKQVELRALVGKGRLAIRLTWAETSEDVRRTDRTDAFADAAAVQFAPLGADGVLPYVGMGEAKRPVSLWFWRAGDLPQGLTAWGFGTLAPARGKPPQASARWRDGAWSLVLAGPLPVKVGPLPVAVALWDGAEQGRDGRKRLTAWHVLRLPGIKEERRTLAALARQARAPGDPARGKALAAEHGCVGCHRLPDGEAVDTGPDLLFVGGVHWPGYVRRSLADPSAFIVPLARYAEPGEGGRPRSLMPAPELDARALDDLTAYLASLR